MDTVNAIRYSPAELPKPSTPAQQKAYDLAQEFESFFIYQMLELSATPSNENGLFGESFAGGMYKQMMHEEISKSMAGTNSIGLADAVYRQLISEQERAMKPMTVEASPAPETINEGE